jgi:hypothetical protein
MNCWLYLYCFLFFSFKINKNYMFCRKNKISYIKDYFLVNFQYENVNAHVCDRPYEHGDESVFYLHENVCDVIF